MKEKKKLLECGSVRMKVQASGWVFLTDLKARLVEDILITTTDNLNGFTQTIRSVFPES